MNAELTVTDGWVRARRGALPLSPGDGLPGGYRIRCWRASGGAGHVFEASHPKRVMPVAIKVPRAELAHSPETEQRFGSEAEVLAALEHPNIVRLLDFNTTASGVPFLVMELLEGSDLRSRMAPGIPWPLASFARMIRQIAQALAFAHRRGIVHRDVKPENVMLVRGSREDVKILDFGLSRIQGRRLTPVEADTTLGTPGYMSPEQISGGFIDGRGDQFNLAAMAFELLTGWPCFRGDNNLAIMYQIMNGRPPPLPAAARPPCPGVQAVLARALSVNPRHRYPTVTEFAEVLLGALSLGSRTSRACAMRARPHPRPRVVGFPAPNRRRPTVRSLKTAAAFVAGLTVFGVAAPPSTQSLRKLHNWALGESVGARARRAASTCVSSAAVPGAVVRTGLAVSGLGPRSALRPAEKAACPAP